MVAAVLAAGCAVSVDVAASTPPTTVTETAPTTAATEDAAPAVRDGAEVRQVLEEVAAAFRRGDPDRLRPHLDEPGTAFGQRWLDRARRMGALPLASYDLRLDDLLPDLATERVRSRFDEPVQVVYVVEELALEGFDDRPAAEDLFLTLVDHDDGWKVAADRDAEELGFVSVDHLWDHGDVEVTRDGPVLAVHHPDGPPIGTLLADTRTALEQVAERWPTAWPERAVVVVPRDEEELGELLHVTFDLSNFVAFAVSTAVGERGEFALTGPRIMVNPARFLDRSTAQRQQVLAHELVHVASRPSAGPRMPSWLEEGVAQVLGDQGSTTGTGLLAAAGSEVALPADAQFVTGGQDRVFLSYQLAWSFLDHLIDAHGAEAVGRFYVEVGRGSVGQPGTTTHLVDRAAREVFDSPLADLVADWRAAG